MPKVSVGSLFSSIVSFSTLDTILFSLSRCELAFAAAAAAAARTLCYCNLHVPEPLLDLGMPLPEPLRKDDRHPALAQVVHRILKVGLYLWVCLSSRVHKQHKVCSIHEQRQCE
tara:strand:+ start:133 stop:474 length:342 start_codon:yes stop_codon:yes gene_type:complete